MQILILRFWGNARDYFYNSKSCGAGSGGSSEMLLTKDPRVNSKYISHQSLITESDLWRWRFTGKGRFGAFPPLGESAIYKTKNVLPKKGWCFCEILVWGGLSWRQGTSFSSHLKSWWSMWRGHTWALSGACALCWCQMLQGGNWSEHKGQGRAPRGQDASSLLLHLINSGSELLLSPAPGPWGRKPGTETSSEGSAGP